MQVAERLRKAATEIEAVAAALNTKLKRCDVCGRAVPEDEVEHQAEFALGQMVTKLRGWADTLAMPQDQRRLRHKKGAKHGE